MTQKEETRRGLRLLVRKCSFRRLKAMSATSPTPPIRKASYGSLVPDAAPNAIPAIRGRTMNSFASRDFINRMRQYTPTIAKQSQTSECGKRNHQSPRIKSAEVRGPSVPRPNDAKQVVTSAKHLHGSKSQSR